MSTPDIELCVALTRAQARLARAVDSTLVVPRPAGDRLAREALTSADLAAQRALNGLPLPERERLGALLASLAAEDPTGRRQEVVP